ncbi:MAG: glutathione S-transferase family protein [bacterium]|nr:glutathione S-transferase family protein [bacterium]
MSSAETEIILHNYPQSPVAEKVRVALGIKGFHWRAVEIPRIPPKPMLIKLTGGYRRTPVMQIGADIYCDSQHIIKELERRHPSPTFFPTKDKGLIWCLSRWTDTVLFDLCTKIVLGAAGDDLPADFAQDRGRLYFGADWQAGIKAAGANLPHLVSQIRAPLSWLDDQLSDGRTFLLGDSAAAIDAQIYFVVWFLRGRWEAGPALLSQFPALLRWEKNVKAIGHGQISEMSGEEAIARAAAYTPVSLDHSDRDDPQGLKTGMQVLISPDVDGGEQPVEGVIKALDAQTITLGHSHEDLGEICVHFPRAGYVVEA